MFDTVSVFGAGTMGHGIAQVCAQAGSSVWLYDIDQARVDAGLAHIQKSLDKGVEKGKVTAEAREATLGKIRGTTDAAIASSQGELLIEAIPENLELKQALFRKLDSHAEEGTVFATNTSSLSVAKIAEAVSDPSRVIGTHFFNPVPIMTLLEIVFHTTTANEVIDAIKEFGAKLGKECIVVKDVPGFATSRLGVCLGMEAIRMLESGVASAEDIDKAMVLGYRHPIGPLRLTDMVGLDVRLAIGSYLARELGNAAFEPPALMRRMVQEGKLGQKSGEGFYRWT
jgi:3-hydroxybutyryl-CoA dehydrogenase